MSYREKIQKILVDQEILNTRMINLSEKLQVVMGLSTEDIQLMFDRGITFNFEIRGISLVIYASSILLDRWTKILRVETEDKNSFPGWFYQKRTIGPKTETICIPDDKAITELLEKIRNEAPR